MTWRVIHDDIYHIGIYTWIDDEKWRISEKIIESLLDNRKSLLDNINSIIQ